MREKYFALTKAPSVSHSLENFADEGNPQQEGVTQMLTEDLQQNLNSAAIQLQAHIAHNDGTVYEVEDLQRALTNWLELSIESLVEDATFHTVEGDRAQAFNRRAWELQLARLQPVEVKEACPIAA